MKSFDTNILLYAVNSDCREHNVCRALVEDALKEREGWIIADQVWFELYRLLRNPLVLKKPLDAGSAASAISWYRERSGWLSCAWEPDMMKDLSAIWNREEIPARNTFDIILGITLKKHGVSRLYTRNRKDFLPAGLPEVIDPLA
jgi:predicted nucleic acid-binding protein